MKPDIIILTGGLSGSSVLAGFLATEGYWLGDDTKKTKYETHENSRLVDLNNDILYESGYAWEDTINIPPPSLDKIVALAEKKDLGRYGRFIEDCNLHRPWLWKDPRLCYTIFFWKNLVDIKRCKVIIMGRDIRQAYTGTLLRGKMPIAFEEFALCEQNCLNHAKKFVEEEGIHHLFLTFEDLIVTPQQTLKTLSEFLCVDLRLNAFEDVYNGPLHQKRWSTIDYYKARIKYLYYLYIRRSTIQFPREEAGW